MADKLSEVLFFSAILHWKKVAAAGVLGLIGVGYYLGKANNEPPVAAPSAEVSEQALFNTRAKDAFADLGLKPAQNTLVFTKNAFCGEAQPYGAEFAAINVAGKEISGTICMTRERQARITVGQ